MESIVKVGDTLPDIDEGLNAGRWTIGLTQTGNEIGLNDAEIEALDAEDLQRWLDLAYNRMQQTGGRWHPGCATDSGRDQRQTCQWRASLAVAVTRRSGKVFVGL